MSALLKLQLKGSLIKHSHRQNYVDSVSFFQVGAPHLLHWILTSAIQIN